MLRLPDLGFMALDRQPDRGRKQGICFRPFFFRFGIRRALQSVRFLGGPCCRVGS